MMQKGLNEYWHLHASAMPVSCVAADAEWQSCTAAGMEWQLPYLTEGQGLCQVLKHIHA